MCYPVRPREMVHRSPSPTPPPPVGQVAELKRLQLPQKGPNRPLRSVRVSGQVRWPECLPRCPPQAPSLGKAPSQQTPLQKDSLFLKVSSDSGSPGELGKRCQVLPKLPFPRNKSEPNSRSLTGKRQRRPPSADRTSPHKVNRKPRGAPTAVTH